MGMHKIPQVIKIGVIVFIGTQVGLVVSWISVCAGKNCFYFHFESGQPAPAGISQNSFR